MAALTFTSKEFQSQLFINRNLIVDYIINHPENISDKENEVDECPYCGSFQVIRYGKTTSGSARRLCHNCGKSFTIKSIYSISKSKRDLNIFERYMDCLITGLSLDKVAESCNININTALNWRDTILKIVSIIINQNKTELSDNNSQTPGKVRIDNNVYLKILSFFILKLIATYTTYFIFFSKYFNENNLHNFLLDEFIRLNLHSPPSSIN